MSTYHTQTTDEFEALLRRKIRRVQQRRDPAVYRVLGSFARDKRALTDAIDRALARVDRDEPRIRCEAPDTGRMTSFVRVKDVESAKRRGLKVTVKSSGREKDMKSPKGGPTVTVIVLDAKRQSAARMFIEGIGSAIDVFGLGRYDRVSGLPYSLDAYMGDEDGHVIDSWALWSDWYLVGCDIEAATRYLKPAATKASEADADDVRPDRFSPKSRLAR